MRLSQCAPVGQGLGSHTTNEGSNNTMFKSTRKSKMVKVAAATAAVGSIAAIGFVGNSPAQADPKQLSALVTVGSDTTQDVMNGLSGFSNGVNFTPVQSSVASGQRQIASFDATTPGGDATVPECIITKTGGPAFERPNGSSAGRAALSRKIEGTLFEDKGRACGLVDVSTSVDFARSSSGPSTPGTPPNQLVYVPLGKDALSFAYYDTSPGTGPGVVDTLTRAQLDNLFDGSGTDVVTINGVRILPCGIQTGSGTYQSWNTATTATVQQDDDATSECRSLALAAGILDLNGRLQEHNAVQLKEVGDLPSVQAIADQVIVGFSASQYIGRSNGLGNPTPPAEVRLGAISDNNVAGGGLNCGFPINPPVAPATVGTPNANFFDNCAGFARTVFNVFAWSTFFRDTDAVTPGIQEGPSFGNADVKSLFQGPTSSVCQASATIQQFGYLPLSGAACGTTTTRGPLVANPAP
jgi:ABC-type phosphate transport system substrate-binding protein